MGALELRRLVAGDCPQAGLVVATNPLWTERYVFPAAQAAAQLEESLRRGDVAIGAFAPQLVGFAWLFPKGAFGRHPYLRLLAVDAGAQGGGVGARLLAEAERHFAGERHLFLLVSDFNDGAQRFYRKHGYAQVGSCPDFAKDGVAEQIWVKRLPGDVRV